jgi:hypothetical protein
LLPHYASYAAAVSRARSTAASLTTFTTAIKDDRLFTELRNRARAELQGLYELARIRYGMPAIPVYLPARKKIMVRGRAHSLGGMPQEIRVYPIHGPASKEYAYWRPSDILIDPPEEVLETIIHEYAHILEAHRHGVMGHEQAFVAAYCDIEQSLVAAGACPASGPAYRFSGCPAGSYGAMQFGRRR